MKVKEQKIVCDAINQEGFDYALRNYSDYSEIKDVEFQNLLLEYLQLCERIEDCINWEKYQQ